MTEEQLKENNILFNELYERTKDCGRVQFINLLMEKERENQELKEQLELSEKARKEAIEFIKEYEKNQNLLKWNEEDYIDVINEIKKYLDIDKGE